MDLSKLDDDNAGLMRNVYSSFLELEKERDSLEKLKMKQKKILGDLWCR